MLQETWTTDSGCQRLRGNHKHSANLQEEPSISFGRLRVIRVVDTLLYRFCIVVFLLLLLWCAQQLWSLFWLLSTCHCQLVATPLLHSPFQPSKMETEARWTGELLSLYQKVTAGDNESRNMLGYMYQHGIDVERNLFLAFKWYQPTIRNIRSTHSHTNTHTHTHIERERERECVCVCVCVD